MKYKISDIEAISSEGTHYYGSTVKVTYAGIIICATMIVFLLILFFLGCVGIIDIVGVEWAFAVVIVYTGLLMWACSYAIMRNNRVRNKIYECLEDAKPYKAKVISMSSFGANDNTYKIKITIYSDDKPINITTTNTNRLGGWHKIFGKHCNKTVPVLYSARYNEVLFLKSLAKNNDILQ